MGEKIRKNKKDGFTLLELVITTVILTVFASIALPRIGNGIEAVRSSEGIQILTALLQAQIAFSQEDPNGNFATLESQLDVTIPPSNNFEDITDADIGHDLGNNFVAQVVRQGNLYDLEINNTGVIICNDRGGSADDHCAINGCGGDGMQCN